MAAAFVDPEGTFANPEASGEDLINAWFGLLALTGLGTGEVATSSEKVEAGMAIVRPYLDPTFTLMRGTGQRYTAGNYVLLDIDAFELSDFVVTEPRDDIRVIRYFVSQPGATSPDAGAVMSAEKAYDFAGVGVACNGDLLVVSYDAVVNDLAVEGEDYRDTGSPRMLTFLRSPEGQWELIALANFNVPEGVPADVECVSPKS